MPITDTQQQVSEAGPATPAAEACLSTITAGTSSTDHGPVFRAVSTHGQRDHTHSSSSIDSLNQTAGLLLSSALSKSSTESYRHAYQMYVRFLQRHLDSQSKALPPNVQHLTLFIAHCYQTGLAAATVTTYVSALGYIFRMGNFEDITQHFIIKKTLQGFQKLKFTKDSRLPITPVVLLKLVDSLTDSVSSHFLRVTFKAMFLLAFHAFLRVGEMTSTGLNNQHFLLRKHVVVTGSAGASPTLEINFPHFKHTTGPSSTHAVSANVNNPKYCPVLALEEYLSIRKHELTDQPLFSFMDGSPISRSFFTQQLKASLKWAGLHEQNYKSHSFRIGAATTAATQGISEGQIQLMGRWKSGAFKKYIRVPMIHL
ncbi:uncharacterized protein [Argopecten irradians]|uniref:uncharacterized protein n=1 Tax=Argopecten irradians TaxID=31199 RepID=UPI003718933A